MNGEPSCSSRDKIVTVKKELKRSDSTTECSICRGDKLNDRTVLNSCIHEFCYNCITEWLKYSNGPICPMCKQSIDTITHSLDKNPIVVEDAVVLNKNARRQDTGPRAHPNLANVRRILQVVCRKYRRRANDFDTDIESQRRSERDEGRITRYEDAKRTIIQQLNSLQLLKDEISEGSEKEFILLQTAFRKLIYIEKLNAIFPANNMYLSAPMAASIHGFREKVVSFLIDEFKAIPVKYSKGPTVLPTEFLHDIYNGADEQVANNVVDHIMKDGIEKSSVASTLSDIMNARIEDVVILCAHIRAYAQHHGSFLDFLKGVDYTLRDNIPFAPSQARQNANNFEVVLDSEDDDDHVDVDGIVQPPRPNFPNPFEPNIPLLQALHSNLGMNPNFTNVFSPFRPPTDLRALFGGGNQSTSESDGDSQMYERPAALLRPPPPAALPQLVLTNADYGLNPTTEHWWKALTADHPRPQPINRPNNDDDSVVVISDDELPLRTFPKHPSRTSNETITLDDTVRSGSRPSSSSSSSRHHRSRRVEKRILSREDGGSRSKRREEDIPSGFTESMYKLLSEYGMSRSADIDKVKHAGEIALRRIRSEKRANLDSLPNSSMTSNSSDDRNFMNEPQNSNHI